MKFKLIERVDICDCVDVCECMPLCVIEVNGINFGEIRWVYDPEQRKNGYLCRTRIFEIFHEDIEVIEKLLDKHITNLSAYFNNKQ